MPTGERRRPQRGFTYLLLLFGLAIGGAALAAVGMQWQQAARRDREAELLFRGLQLRDALQRFHDQTPDGQPALPQSLDDLLTDRRRPAPRHHLRQAWVDPFTGQADWVLLRTPDGGITGLHSRSAQPLLRHADLPDGVRVATQAAPEPRPPRAMDWHFAIQPRLSRTRPTP